MFEDRTNLLDEFCLPERDIQFSDILFATYSINDIESILKLNTVAVHVRSGDYKDLGSQGFFVLGKI